jgi:hypothetical protein
MSFGFNRNRAIVYLLGGLGNQLFQYGYGQCLRSHGYDVRYNSYFLQGFNGKDPLRRYGLGAFPINPISYGPWSVRLRRLCGWRLFRDQPLHSVHPLPKGPVLAVGYWQHPRYAAGIRDEVRLRLPAVEDRARGCIALGIRRGDYVRDPSVTSSFGVLDLDYYRRALEAVPNKPVVIFTDDPAWAQTVFIPEMGLHGRATLAPEADDWQTLAFMQQADHFVIANSSFHWWGAFLSGRTSVIAPKAWSREQSERCPILPESWSVR